MGSEADITNLWSGQAVRLVRRSLPAGQLTRILAQEPAEKLKGHGRTGGCRQDVMAPPCGYRKDQ